MGTLLMPQLAYVIMMATDGKMSYRGQANSSHNDD